VPAVPRVRAAATSSGRAIRPTEAHQRGLLLAGMETGIQTPQRVSAARAALPIVLAADMWGGASPDFALMQSVCQNRFLLDTLKHQLL
jgi:hypothetical protein